MSDGPQKIVESYGRSSLARMALFDDKTYYFSPGGSMVAYALRERVGLALGDPIGPIEDGAGAIRLSSTIARRMTGSRLLSDSSGFLSDYKNLALIFFASGRKPL
jgi:lysylphosphatidylglycerol synthetase-like protein (DUF2156 family)